MNGPTIVHGDETPEYYFEERCHIAEWWNDGADEDCSIVRARVEPGVTTRLHRLHGVTERYVVLQGSGRVEVGADARPETVTAGGVVVIPPDAPQRITNVGDDDLVFLAICTPRFRPECYEDIDAGG